VSGVLIIGSTGLFGQALMAEAAARGGAVAGAARKGTAITVDIGDDASIEAALKEARPSLVVNAAAMIDIGQCEDDPSNAWRINARAAGRVSELAAKCGARTVHISTDHFYTGDGARAHREEDPVVFVNEYARTKYAGEELVMAQEDAMVVRTNILGFRGWEKPTFIEWVIATILEDREATLFQDSFVSAIDVGTAAAIILDLAAADARGIVNVGCREVYSKKDLVERLAARLDRRLTRARPGSVLELPVRRAESLGLDVSRAEGILGRKLPDLGTVIDAIVKAGTERNAL
jgi:dTDP-4-dehydrorhamnose reductase